MPSARSVTGMLARLHAVPADRGDVPVRALDLPDRGVVEASLQERAGSWQTGPYGERARVLVNEHAASLAKALDAFDELTAELAAALPDEPETEQDCHDDDDLVRVDGDPGFEPGEEDAGLPGPEEGMDLDGEDRRCCDEAKQGVCRRPACVRLPGGDDAVSGSAGGLRMVDFKPAAGGGGD